MPETPKNLDAVLAEMRSDADVAALAFLTPDGLRGYADLIEAAVARERAKYERLHECFWNVDSIQSIVRQMLDERDDLRDKNPQASEVAAHFAQLLTKAATPAPGNTLKMRAALERCNELFRCDDDNKSRLCHLARKADEATQAAFSAPARNCDRPFRSTNEAIGAYVGERGDGPHLGYCDAIKWALAPAEGGDHA